jgi:DNA replication initiation complex subunit (GINS family)
MSKTIRLTESELHNIIKESVINILENNYKNRYSKIVAAKHASGKSPEEVRNEMQNYFAKCQAISDINKDRDVLNMTPHEKEFNHSVNSKTFDIDFSDFE